MSECCETKQKCEPYPDPGPKGNRGATGNDGPQGQRGAGMPDDTDVIPVGNYLEWNFAGQVFHHRALSGPAPTS